MFERLAAIATALTAPFRALATAEGRRGWAVVLLAGGGVSGTALAAWSLYLVRHDTRSAFYLGLTAMLLNIIVFTGFAAMLVSRTIKGQIMGNSFEISDAARTAAIAAAAVVTAREEGTEHDPA
ncbi:MAG: hypothetical protein CVT77_09455 [Alphaproteobacteria bacterium HGW-Alphaproteobacteria-16]|nr:MAG: hypothetical protein CVT77_09455 [Alphaproteobacteria bacterium HGW-Alphaproteobacteria-16]